MGVNNKERWNSTLKLPGCLHFFLYALGKKTLLAVSLSHGSPNMFKGNKWLVQSLQPLKGKYETWTLRWHVPVLDNIEELPYSECNISTFHSRCSHSLTLSPSYSFSHLYIFLAYIFAISTCMLPMHRGLMFRSNWKQFLLNILHFSYCHALTSTNNKQHHIAKQ